MLTAIISITALGSLFGLGLGWAAGKFKVDSDPVVDQINAVLPQTQCGQCNFPGCRPYAEAIAADEANINQCPPGGEMVIQVLADLLGIEAMALNPDNGAEKPKTAAVIDEEICIGQRRGKTKNCGSDRRGDLHRLHTLYSGLSGGRDPWRKQADAHSH